MKFIALLVHGYNVRRPDGTIGKLKSFFEANGIPCIMVDYGFTSFLDTKWVNPKVAEQIADITKAVACSSNTKILAVGHSNGCAILHLATKNFKARIDYLSYINPALKRTYAPGENVKWCDIYHSPSDLPVRASKWISFVTNLLSEKWFNARPWGAMGAYGYFGDDVRMNNINKQNDFLVKSSSHSDMFDFDKIAYFGPMIVEKMKSAFSQE